MTTKENLIEAKKLVQRGWIQHSFSRDGGFCMVGACAEAARGEGVMNCSPALVMLRRALGLGDGESLFPFNDQKGRTKADVLAVFDQAIASCD